MIRFRTVRIALTSLLAAAIATQPMVGLRAAEGCAEGASGSDCGGCGCCDVQDPSKLCGCCGEDQPSDSRSDCGRPPRTAGVTGEKKTLEPLAAALQARVCTCHLSPAPISEGRQHHRAVEDTPRSDVTLGAAYPGHDRQSFASRPRPLRLDARGNQAHFSQRVLGVWRN